MENILHSQWSLYIHDLMSEDWTINGYKKILTIETIEDFHILFNNLHKIVNNYYYFLMRDDYLPLWENNNGGAWSFRIPKDNTLKFFKDISIYTIGETICENPLNIIGITTSPKEKFNTIKIWTINSCGKFIYDKNRNIDFKVAQYKKW